MAEVTKEIVHDRKGGSGFVAWLALILAIAALTLAWLAYNRSGQDLESRISNQVNQALNQAEERTPDVQTPNVESPEVQQEVQNEVDNNPATE